jgi:hypothetical protein
MNKIIFLIAPTAHGTDWAVNKTRLFFNVPEKTFTFKFGFTLTLDLIGRIKPFNRIVETIKTLQSKFPEFSFVFCGWELIECLDELYEKFPDAEFFITTKTFNEHITNILLEEDVGVMLAEYPVISVKVLLFIENVSVLVVLTTCKTVPAVLLVRIVPVSAGSVSVFVPATAGAEIVTCPDVSPVKTSEAISIL